jgi:XTP/dITP diphosphohydrolase
VTAPSQLLLATRSLGKLHELHPLFAGAGLAVIDLQEAGIDESPEEDALEVYDTFEENALAKARYFHQRSRGLPTIADDSGLEVAALGGRPGVRTKRFSGRDDLSGRALDAANNATLLAALTGVVEERRDARYVCVAALVDAASERTWRGTATGRILFAPRGSEGFGYDPLFLSDDLGVTFAQVPREAKETVSHRGRALASLIASLRR